MPSHMVNLVLFGQYYGVFLHVKQNSEWTFMDTRLTVRKNDH